MWEEDRNSRRQYLHLWPVWVCVDLAYYLNKALEPRYRFAISCHIISLNIDRFWVIITVAAVGKFNPFLLHKCLSFISYLRSCYMLCLEKKYRYGFSHWGKLQLWFKVGKIMQGEKKIFFQSLSRSGILISQQNTTIDQTWQLPT